MGTYYSAGPIRRSQFGEKLNNFDSTSIALRRQQKSFVMSSRQYYSEMYF